VLLGFAYQGAQIIKIRPVHTHSYEELYFGLSRCFDQNSSFTDRGALELAYTFVHQHLPNFLDFRRFDMRLPPGQITLHVFAAHQVDIVAHFVQPYE
jgi:hypothetical protein